MKGRKCTKCNLFKAWTEFNKQKKGKNGYRSYCRECQSKDKKNWRKGLSEEYKKAQAEDSLRRYRLKSLEERKIIYQQRKEYVKNYHSRPENKIRIRASAAARQRKKYSQMSLEERTLIYERRKEYVKAWVERNKNRYKDIQRRGQHTRRARLNGSNSEPLTKNHTEALLEFNTLYFGLTVFICEYCGGEVGKDYHIEHIVPICKGGTNVITNLAISCAKCNHGKLAKDLEFYRPDKVAYFQSRNSLLIKLFQNRTL